MSISSEDVLHIAALARLGIPPEQVGSLARELTSILGHMDALQNADTGDVPDDDIQGRGALRLRDDEGPPVPLARPREAFAPMVRDAFLLVPRLATHEAGEDAE